MTDAAPLPKDIAKIVKDLRHDAQQLMRMAKQAAFAGEETGVRVRAPELLHAVMTDAADYLEAAPAREAALRDEIERLEKQVYVPGHWRCAKCNFYLVQATLYARTGNVGSRDEPGDKCPNCDVPLWRVTERQAGNEMVLRCEEQVDRAVKAEAALAQARADALAEAWRPMSEAPEVGRKFIAVYNDGSGALMFWAFDGGFIDQDGEEWSELPTHLDSWCYLPDIEFWCECREEDPMTLSMDRALKDARP